MSQNDIVNEILQEMNRKYGEEFSLDTFCEGQAGSPYTMVLVTCRSCPGQEIMARASRNEQGGWIVQDNYISYYLKEFVRKEVAAIAEGIYGDCKVYYKPASMVLPVEYSIEMGEKEFLSRKESMTHIYIYLPPSVPIEEKEEKAELLQKDLSRKGYKMKGLICYVENLVFFESINDISFRVAYMDSEQVLNRGIFLLEKAEGYSYLRWKDGSYTSALSGCN